jgi:mono/diheme cytochrome c family protein
MKQAGIGSVQRALIAVMILAVTAVGLYFAFRRTIIADIREAVIAPDTSDLVTYGATLFQTRGCGGCHTLSVANVVGDVGPDLDGIGLRHDADFIRQSIVNPNAVIAENCPEGACDANVMPEWGSILNDQQVEALVAYLINQQ